MMKKKIFALVLALVTVLALVPAMAQAGSEQEDVTISKTATAVEGMVNAWDIELTVNAAAKVNPTPGNDVILVLDNSNSMYEGSRMANAKRAAKAFLDQLLPAGNTANRVGVVVFNSEVPSYQPLTADRAALEKFIGGVDQSLNGSPYTRPGYDKGGTFLEVGIEQAAELLRGSGANIKSMVLLSDGAPTYVRVNDKVVGDGTNYDETMYQPTVNAAKKSGAVVYSVALSAGEDGEHVLRGCASDTGKFFAVRNENDVAGLKDVFVTIAGTMTTACKNASVVDEMGRGFVVNGTPTTESGADYNVYYYAAALKNLMQENFELAQSDTFILENGRDAVVLVFNEKVLPEPETVTVTAAKVWDDGDSAERPASAAVQLLANGEPYGEPATLSAESGWTCAWEVPETDESGAAIVYTVREVSVPDGYEVSYSVAEDGTLVITNTLKKAGPVTPTDPETPTTPETPAQTGAKSGDGFQLWLYAAAGVLALAGAAALVILPNRRHGKREAK